MKKSTSIIIISIIITLILLLIYLNPSILLPIDRSCEYSRHVVSIRATYQEIPFSLFQLDSDSENNLTDGTFQLNISVSPEKRRPVNVPYTIDKGNRKAIPGLGSTEMDMGFHKDRSEQVILYLTWKITNADPDISSFVIFNGNNSLPISLNWHGTTVTSTKEASDNMTTIQTDEYGLPRIIINNIVTMNVGVSEQNVC